MEFNSESLLRLSTENNYVTPTDCLLFLRDIRILYISLLTQTDTQKTLSCLVQTLVKDKASEKYNEELEFSWVEHTNYTRSLL